MSWLGDGIPAPMTPEDMWAIVNNYNVRPNGPWQSGLLTDNSGSGGIFVGQGATPETIGSQPLFQQGVGVLHESVGEMIRSMGNQIAAGELDMSVVPGFLKDQVANYIQANYGDQPRFEDEPPTEDYTDFVPEDEPILEPTYSDEPAVENKGALDWWLKNGDRTNAGQRFAHLSDEQKDYLVANDPSLAPEFGRGEMLAGQSGQNSVDAIDSQIEDPNIVDRDLTEGDLSGLDEESLLNSFQGEARGALDDILDSTGDMDEFLEGQFRLLEEQMLRGGGLGTRVNGDGSIDLIGNLGLPGPLGIFEIQLRDKDGNITAGTTIRNAVESVWKKISSVPEKVVKTAQEVVDVLTGKGNTVGGIDLSGNILDTTGRIIGSILDSEVGPLLSGSWITPEVLQSIYDLVNDTVDFGSGGGGSPSDNSGAGEPATGSEGAEGSTTGSEGTGESTTDKSDQIKPPLGGEALDEEEDKDDEPRFTDTSSGSDTSDETPLTEDDGPVITIDTNNGGGGGGDGIFSGGGDGDGGGGTFSDGGGGDGDNGGGGGETTGSENPPLSTGSGGGGGGGGGGGLFASNPYMGGLGYDLQAPRSVVYDPTDPMIQLDRIIQKSLFQGMI